MRLALFLLAAACDPAYSLHLHAHVSRAGAPYSGVWVFGLNTDILYPPSTARTGADGRAEIELKALHHNPAADPVAVAARLDELFVAVPGRDFTPRRRGFLWSTDFEAALEVALSPPRPELSLRCEGGQCTVEGPDLESCSWYEVAVDDAHAEGHRIGDRPSVSSGHRRVSFAMRGGARIAVVAACLDGSSLRALVSNVSG